MIAPSRAKKIIYFTLAAGLLLSYANLAFAEDVPDYTQGKTNPVSSQIEKYLCAPSDASNSQVNTNIFGHTANNTSGGNNLAQNDLYVCINKLYRFAIAAGSVVGILFIVISGYLYIASDGNQETVDKAKSIFTSSITAMVILFGGWVLLKALNPDLLKFQNIQPPSVKLATVTPPTVLGTDTATAAQTILNLNGSKLSIASTGCDCPGNCAIKSLSDLAAGKQAVYDGPGTTCNAGFTPVSSTMLNALISAANSGNNFMIQSITGGHHSSSADPHYSGQAVDVTPNPATASNQKKLAATFRAGGASQIASECGSTFIVLSSTNDDIATCIGQSGYHIHAKW